MSCRLLKEILVESLVASSPQIKHELEKLSANLVADCDQHTLPTQNRDNWPISMIKDRLYNVYDLLYLQRVVQQRLTFDVQERLYWMVKNVCEACVVPRFATRSWYFLRRPMITHAAFTLGPLSYCRSNNALHLGFIILDSLHLGYREPDGKEEDLRGTDLKEQFYCYLQALPVDQQAIVVENSDPPEAIKALSKCRCSARIHTVGGTFCSGTT